MFGKVAEFSKINTAMEKTVMIIKNLERTIPDEDHHHYKKHPIRDLFSKLDMIE